MPRYPCYEFVVKTETTVSVKLVGDNGLDLLARAYSAPYSIPLAEHLKGWAQAGSFDPVGWEPEDGVHVRARMLHPDEPDSIALQGRNSR